MIRVVVVEDSAVVRELLLHIFAHTADMNVVGVAKNGEEALALVSRLRPDVITMDIHMPVMDGIAATRHIMETIPTPIVVVTGSGSEHASADGFRVIEAGALAVVQRPFGVGHSDHAASVKAMLDSVRLMSEIKVVRRWPRHNAAIINALEHPVRPRIIVIGASTGGPVVIQTILAGMNKTQVPPILIVQHISDGFVAGFALWLCNTTGFPVHVATQGEILQNGHVYIAPDACHMGLINSGPDGTMKIALSETPAIQGLRPAVAHLFASAFLQAGNAQVAILLSGMGKDGALELKHLHDAGAMTIAQDEQSSAVHGMPGAAIQLGGARKVLSPEAIVMFLNQLLECKQA